MPADPFSLRQADQARTDFAIIEDELEAINKRLGQLPTRNEVWRAALLGMLEHGSTELLFGNLYNGGTETSNPSPSSGESGANLIFGGESAPRTCQHRVAACSSHLG